MTMTTASRAVIDVDPAEIAEHPANLRKAKGDLTGLKASIAELGILQPIVVTELPDGALQVLAGHRRLAAAVELEMRSVPVRVLDLGANPDALAMLAENVQRKDLTVAEEADAYLQLQAAELDVETIARRAGVEVERVQRSLTVGASKAAAAVAQKHDLTLDHAVVIAEFDGNRDAVKALTVTAVDDPDQFEHVASRLRLDADLDRQEAEATAKLKSDGVKLLPRTETIGRELRKGKPCRLDELAGKRKDRHMTPSEHKDCPGHRAKVRRQWHDVEVLYCCVDPVKHGHKPMYSQRLSRGPGGRKAEDVSDAEREAAKAERRQVIENNKAWKAATEVRREFVTKLLQRKAPPKGALRYATLEIVGAPEYVARAAEKLISAFLGEVGQDKAEHETSWSYAHSAGLTFARSASDATLPQALLAQVAAAAETSLDGLTWRSTYGACSRYLAFLEECGYTLAPVERIPLDAGAGKTRE